MIITIHVSYQKSCKLRGDQQISKYCWSAGQIVVFTTLIATPIGQGAPIMVTLTRPQRISVHRKWAQNDQDMAYRQFRKTVLPEMGSKDAVMVKWSNMWLGIEADGYTHS